MRYAIGDNQEPVFKTYQNKDQHHKAQFGNREIEGGCIFKEMCDYCTVCRQYTTEQQLQEF